MTNVGKVIFAKTKWTYYYIHVQHKELWAEQC